MYRLTYSTIARNCLHAPLRSTRSQAVVVLSTSSHHLRNFNTSSQALNDGTIKSRVARRKRSSALQEAFKFGEDDEDEGETRAAILASRTKGTAVPVIEEAPNLEFLAKRWEKIDPLEQEEIALYLEQRMRSEWSELSLLEKQASKCDLMFDVWCSLTFFFFFF